MIPRTLLLAPAALLAAACAGPAGAPPPDRAMNVLFIAVDDLRPELGPDDEMGALTPALDRLAAEGVSFRRQYVQVPTCGASRYAMLTGQYPRTAEQLGNEAFVRLLPRVEGARPESWVHHFRRNGYHTAAIGKVSHYPDSRVFAYDGTGQGAPEMPFSWSEAEGPTGKWGTAWNAFFGYADGSSRNSPGGRNPAYEAADVPDSAYPDGVIADATIRKLGELRGRPFVLAVGFFKPHLPFTAPRRYWDLYDPAAIPPTPVPGPPAGVNPRTLHASSEMFGNYAHPARGGAGVRLDEAYARTLRHGYLAATSYVDAQIGRVLDELDRLGLRDNTLVVLWGDHGWHLGDHTIWGKHTTLERSLRSPLLVRVPGTRHPGAATEAIVEAVDIYPTLVELAGLPDPGPLDGRSFAHLLRHPNGPGKEGAYGRYPGRRTLRTDRYRITEHESGEPRVELFDHAADPQETVNVAERHPEVVVRLLPRLRAWP